MIHKIIQKGLEGEEREKGRTFTKGFPFSHSDFCLSHLTGQTYKKLRKQLKVNEEQRYQLKIELDKLRLKRFRKTSYEEFHSINPESARSSVCAVFIIANYENISLERVFEKYNYSEIINKARKYSKKKHKNSCHSEIRGYKNKEPS